MLTPSQEMYVGYVMEESRAVTSNKWVEWYTCMLIPPDVQSSKWKYTKSLDIHDYKKKKYIVKNKI